MSSAQQAMNEWIEKFGYVDPFPSDTRVGGSGGGRFPFELDVAYPCKITRAKCVKSKFGDLQIQLSMDVQNGDGEGDDVGVAGQTTHWLDLPKQPGDLKRDKETVIKMTQRRYENLLRVLSAAAPPRFALYADKKSTEGGNTFYDFDGEKMDGSDFNDRKAEIHSACVKFADDLQEGDDVELLEGALLFIVKAENKRNAKYPYTNIYAKPPEGKKMFAGGEGESSDGVPF